jgi:signal transduction histidine kinase
MTELLDDLLDIASLESGKSILNLRPVEIEAFVLYCVDVNRPLSEEKEIRVETNFSPNLSVLMLDQTKMEQVLNNLLSNAIKYSYPRTTIWVKTAVIENELIIEVQDEGQGIPQEDLETVFEPFVTSSVKTTGGETSTGLGLAIVKRVVERHGGRIWVESTVGVGSSFFVALPVSELQ